MANGSLVLITGGVRSGKSSFAEELARTSGKKVVYVATAKVEDREMEARVACHRRRRPAEWETVEESLDLPRVIEERGQAGTVMLVDCLGVYLSNLLLGQVHFPPEAEEFVLPAEQEAHLKSSMDKAARAAAESPADLIVVTNEVGWGLVPPYPLGRIYRDLLGWTNQQFASRADAVYLIVAGIPLNIKSLACN